MAVIIVNVSYHCQLTMTIQIYAYGVPQIKHAASQYDSGVLTKQPLHLLFCFEIEQNLQTCASNYTNWKIKQNVS
jgi:hypothetical protein